MDWLTAPFEVAFVQRALWGGILVSLICALAGTWVVLRGMAFLGDAMAHGLLPGVAVAALLGGPLAAGAAVSAVVMALGVTAVGRVPRLSQDTSIGLLFVGMLSLGVIVVSRSPSFAVDLTGFLFGDVLAVRDADLVRLGLAAVLALTVTALGHRAFVALAFDERKARTLGLRPRAAHAALLGLLTVAIVASFHVVGTLLVLGLLIAPPATALPWARRIPAVMATAACLGASATFLGLLLSWHLGTAAGASVAAVAVLQFLVSTAVLAVRGRPGVRSAAPHGRTDVFPRGSPERAGRAPKNQGPEEPRPHERPAPDSHLQQRGPEDRETARPPERPAQEHVRTGPSRLPERNTGTDR
ncbi:manganese/iron transport system permease protein [Streptomyces sp. AmelKG-E11A]|nr:manganese/iron transport system permease protein [Streptomyces sp. AmelKG-E11A]